MKNKECRDQEKKNTAKKRISILLCFVFLFASGSNIWISHPGITIQDVRNFLKIDKTNERKWSIDYTCTDFTYDLFQNASGAGFESWPITIIFEDGSAHMMLAFKTIEGNILIEPQADTRWEIRPINETRYLCMFDNITCYPHPINSMDEW